MENGDVITSQPISTLQYPQTINPQEESEENERKKKGDSWSEPIASGFDGIGDIVLMDAINRTVNPHPHNSDCDCGSCNCNDCCCCCCCFDGDSGSNNDGCCGDGGDGSGDCCGDGDCDCCAGDGDCDCGDCDCDCGDCTLL